MGQLYVPAKREVKGPWLLSVGDLESLDHILESIEVKISESAEKQLCFEAQESVDKGEYPSLYPDFDTALTKLREHYNNISFSAYKKTKEVTLISSDEKTLTDNSIKEIIRDSRLKDFTPETIRIGIRELNNKFTLSVGRRFDGSLDYDVDCYDQKCKDEIIYNIDSWIDKHKPNRIRQKWASIWFFLSVFGIILPISFLPLIFTTQSYDYKPTYIKELNNLLEKGLSKENQPKAVELFIKYQTNYLPSNIDKKEFIKVDHQWLRASVVLLLIGIASIFRPKTTIGLGRHKNLVEIYNTYIKIVFVTIPGGIIFPPLFLFARRLLGL